MQHLGPNTNYIANQCNHLERGDEVTLEKRKTSINCLEFREMSKEKPNPPLLHLACELQQPVL